MENYLSEIKHFADNLIEANPHQADPGHTKGTIHNLQSLVSNSAANAEKIITSFNLKANEIVLKSQNENCEDIVGLKKKIKEIGTQMINNYQIKFAEKFK